MNRIGKFEFNSSCELQVVNGIGWSAPINDAIEVGLDVRCVLYCDDPEDGVFAEDIEATIEGTNIELGKEAIALLDLSCAAGEAFMDSGVIHPRKGAKYMDTAQRIWTVVGSGMHHEEARDYTMLERRIGGRLMDRDPYRRLVIEANLLMQPPTVLACGHEDDDDCIVVGCENENDENQTPMFRKVIEEGEPGPGLSREMYAVYVGKPTGGSAAEKLLSTPVSLEPGSRGLGEVDGKTVADRAREKVAKARSLDGSDKCPTGEHAPNKCPGDHGK